LAGSAEIDSNISMQLITFSNVFHTKMYQYSWCCYLPQRKQHQIDFIARDQPNSREKMHDFTAEFLKCVIFHGKFTESLVNSREIHGPLRRYFEVLR